MSKTKKIPKNKFVLKQIKRGMENACNALGVYDTIITSYLTKKKKPEIHDELIFYEMYLISSSKILPNNAVSPTWTKQSTSIFQIEQSLCHAKEELRHSFLVWYSNEVFSKDESQKLLSKKVELTKKINLAIKSLQELYPEFLE